MIEIRGKLHTNLRPSCNPIGINICIVISAHIVYSVRGKDTVIIIQYHYPTMYIRQRRSIDHPHLVIGSLAPLDNKRELLLCHHIHGNEG